METVLVDKIVKEIFQLKTCFKDIVIVSNNIFEDGVEYDASTKCYMRVLGEVNRQIAEMSDRVVEVVVGIPLVVKG